MSEQQQMPYTTEELEQMLAKRKKIDLKNRQKEEDKYIEERDARVMNLVDKALQIELQLQAFKEECHALLELQEERLRSFGKLNKKSKGGFSITHSNETRRVTRIRKTKPVWNEFADKAEALIKEFLSDTVKKKDKKLFGILISFIEKNKEGKLEYRQVMNLVKHEDKYDDPRWVEGLRLIKASFNYRLDGYGYEFKVADKDHTLRNIELSFTTI